MAAEILQSYEQLAWYALARNEVSLIELKKKKERHLEMQSQVFGTLDLSGGNSPF
jgi:hypothetical protein